MLDVGMEEGAGSNKCNTGTNTESALRSWNLSSTSVKTAEVVVLLVKTSRSDPMGTVSSWDRSVVLGPRGLRLVARGVLKTLG